MYFEQYLSEPEVGCFISYYKHELINPYNEKAFFLPLFVLNPKTTRIASYIVKVFKQPITKPVIL